MKRTLTLSLLAVASLFAGCTFNVSTGNSNASAPASNTTAANTTNSAPASANNQTANTATAPKKEDNTPNKEIGSEPSETKSGDTNVNFAPGKTTTAVKKDIPANGSIDLTFHAKQGQRMVYSANYDFNGEDLELFLTEPGSQDVSSESQANEPNEFYVKKTGVHRVTVNNKTGKRLSFDFGLTIY